MKHLYLTLLAVLVLSLNFVGQIYSPELDSQTEQRQIQKPGIVGLPETIDTFVPPPAGFQYGAQRVATINVNYTGFTVQAQNAFQYAVDIWASILTSPVVIEIDAEWTVLDGNTLGSAGANGHYPTVDALPGFYFHAALADKLNSSDQEPFESDVICRFNSESNWYLGTDGNPGDLQYDFVSVVLHELGHGLGFAGLSGYDINNEVETVPGIYDFYVEDNNFIDILDFTDGSSALENALTGDNLFWNGTFGVAGAGGTRPKLYVPSPYEPGSSYSHLDENTYPAGSGNSLMTPFIANGEAVHNPGPIALGMMEDMGWTVGEAGGCEDLEYQLVLDLDCYGNETTWTLTSGATTYASGGPYDGILPNGPGTEIIDLCLPENTCFTFTINDSFSDGMNGSAEDECDVDGDYYMLDEFGGFVFGLEVLNFGAQATHDFCTTDGGLCSADNMVLLNNGCVDTGDGLGELPEVEFVFDIGGDCLVQEICIQTNGGGFECTDLIDLDIFVGDGESVFLPNNPENAFIQAYFVTTDGAVSPLGSITASNCEQDVFGCTDPLAQNYNPAATINDGSCVYDNCVVTDLTLTQNCITVDGEIVNRILVNFDINGDCNILDVCYQPFGTTDVTCFDLPGQDILVYDGEGVFIPIAEGPGTYQVWATTVGGTSAMEIISIDCSGEIVDCANPFAVNYNPNATTGDESLCNYDTFICDCAGTQHTIGSMIWLGDNSLDDGSFNWDQQPVDFNCLTWGFDCGDGGVFNDPNNVCDGLLPPNSGCEAGGCAPLNMVISQNDCQSIEGAALTPQIAFDVFFSGNCTVEDFCIQIDGGGFECTNLPGLEDPIILENGEGLFLNSTTPDAFYEFYFTTSDGSQSPIFTWINGNCDNEETICDCSGTQHSIGVTAWIGDGFLDDDSYVWAGETVNFNCSTWGFDCGDGGVNNDPNGVCLGNLPPNNGCVGQVLGCTDPTALNYNPAATLENGSCIYDIPGCTDIFATNYNPDATINDGSCIYDGVDGCVNINACNFNPEATVDDGSCEFDSCAGCINPNACNFDPSATIDNGTCEFVSCAGCTNPNACNFDPSATIDSGDCEYVSCAGCTEPGACNYDATATLNNGTCEYITCAGCTTPNACNYDATATLDNGTCEYITCAGCIDVGACNYDATATIDNGTCEYITCAGCTDILAQNYDASATIDDGSCIYGDIEGCTDPTACNYLFQANIEDGSCEYLTCAGCTDAEACNYDATATLDNGTCEYLTCAGCTDAGACNYDPTATLDDDSCEYLTCAGCTDVEACNYDADAVLDDNSCEFESCAGCTDETALNYDATATIDDGSCVYDCEYPTLTWTAVNCDDQTGMFSVDMNVTDLGNGAPYGVTNNINDDEVTLNFNGTVQLGPFDINDQVVISVSSNIIPNCFLTSPVMSCTNSIDENESVEWSMYPNPTADVLNITLESNASIESIQILDVSGRIVYNAAINTFERSTDGTIQLPVHELAGGYYAVQLIGADYNGTKQLIIQK